jgi:hypothetical protein
MKIRILYNIYVYNNTRKRVPEPVSVLLLPMMRVPIRNDLKIFAGYGGFATNLDQMTEQCLDPKTIIKNHKIYQSNDAFKKLFQNKA